MSDGASGLVGADLHGMQSGQTAIQDAIDSLQNLASRLDAARDATHGTEPWMSDGTSAGTTMIADVSPHASSWPSNFGYTNGKLVFSADDGTHGREPMVLRWPPV